MVSFSNHTEGTALSCAAANGHEMIVQYLLHNDVKTSGGYHECDCDLKVTTFIFAVYHEPLVVASSS